MKGVHAAYVWINARNALGLLKTLSNALKTWQRKRQMVYKDIKCRLESQNVLAGLS